MIRKKTILKTFCFPSKVLQEEYLTKTNIWLLASFDSFQTILFRFMQIFYWNVTWYCLLCHFSHHSTWTHKSRNKKMLPDWHLWNSKGDSSTSRPMMRWFEEKTHLGIPITAVKKSSHSFIQPFSHLPIHLEHIFEVPIIYQALSWPWMYKSEQSNHSRN